MKTIKDSPYKLIVIFEVSVLVGIFLAYFTARVPILVTKFLSLTPQFVNFQDALRFFDEVLSIDPGHKDAENKIKEIKSKIY